MHSTQGTLGNQHGAPPVPPSYCDALDAAMVADPRGLRTSQADWHMIGRGYRATAWHVMGQSLRRRFRPARPARPRPRSPPRTKADQGRGRFGAGGRNRTDTPLREPDFESGASTSSTTPATRADHAATAARNQSLARPRARTVAWAASLSAWKCARKAAPPSACGPAFSRVAAWM